MAEETLRYRVEFDQSQVQGSLSRLRGAVGHTLGGGTPTAHALNSLQSDLMMGRQSMFASMMPSAQSMRSFEGAVLGAAFSGISTGMVGLGAAGAGYGFAAGGGIGALPGLALMGAGVGMSAVGDRVINDFRARADIQDILTAGGVSTSGARGAASSIVAGGRNMGMTAMRMTNVAESAVASGMISPMTARDPQKVAQRVIEAAKRAAELEQLLNVSMDQAMSILGENESMGISSGAVMGNLLRGGAIGAATGLGGTVMARASRMGANLAANMGISGSAGANVAMQSMAMAQQGLSALNPALARSLGGVQGFSQTLTMANMQVNPISQMMSTNPTMMRQFADGTMSISDAVLAGSREMMRGGPQNLAKNVFAMDDAMADMTASEIRAQQIGLLAGAANDLGVRDSSQLALLAGNVIGADVGTRRGRAAARAFLAGMSPEVVQRNIAEMEARADVIARDAISNAPGIGEGIYNATIGRLTNAVSGSISGAVSEAEIRLAESAEGLSGFAGNFLRAVPGAQALGIVRSDALRTRRVKLPGSFRDTRVQDLVTKSLDALGGLSTKEIVEGKLKEKGLLKTVAQEEREQRINEMFRSSEKTVKRHGKKVSKIVARLEAGENNFEGLMEEMRGKSRKEQIGMLIGATDLTGTDTDQRIAAAAIKELDIEAEANLDSARILELGEEAQTKGMANLGFLRSGISPVAGEGLFETARVSGAISGLFTPGQTSEQQVSMLATVQAYLAAGDEDALMVRRKLTTMVSDESLQKINEIKKNDKDLAIKMISSVTRPMQEAATFGVAAQMGVRGLEGDIGKRISQLGDVVTASGAESEATAMLRRSSRPEDRVQLEALTEIRNAIQEERRILQLIMKRFGDMDFNPGANPWTSSVDARNR